MTGWQPIGTAPKDGAEILLYFPEGKIGSAKWRKGIFGGPKEWFSAEGSRLCLAYDPPTHWMPLPPPPEESK